MNSNAGKACTVDAMDRWTAIAEQYYKRRYARPSERAVWRELMNEAWDALAANVHEIPATMATPKHMYKATISWSGPMFATMDGGDYHWGEDTYYSSDLSDLVNYVVAALIDMKLEGYQSAECEINYESPKPGHHKVEMKDIKIPWETNSHSQEAPR